MWKTLSTERFENGKKSNDNPLLILRLEWLWRQKVEVSVRGNKGFIKTLKTEFIIKIILQNAKSKTIL